MPDNAETLQAEWLDNEAKNTPKQSFVSALDDDLWCDTINSFVSIVCDMVKVEPRPRNQVEPVAKSGKAILQKRLGNRATSDEAVFSISFLLLAGSIARDVVKNKRAESGKQTPVDFGEERNGENASN